MQLTTQELRYLQTYKDGKRNGYELSKPQSDLNNYLASQYGPIACDEEGGGHGICDIITFAFKQYLIDVACNNVPEWDPIVVYDAHRHEELNEEENMVLEAMRVVDKFLSCYGIICIGVPQYIIDAAWKFVTELGEYSAVVKGCYVAKHNNPKQLLQEILDNVAFMRAIDEHWNEMLSYPFAYSNSDSHELDSELKAMFTIDKLMDKSVRNVYHSVKMTYMKHQYYRCGINLTLNEVMKRLLDEERSTLSRYDYQFDRVPSMINIAPEEDFTPLRFMR